MSSKRRFVALPSFNAVGVGQRATLNLPVGARKYYKVIITYKAGADNQATIEAALKNMRVLVNGVQQIEHTVAELNQLNAYRGRAFQTGTVILYFSDPGARTMTGEEILGWGTYNLSTLSIELDIDAAAVAPALSAQAEIEDSNEPLGVIKKVVRQTGFVTAGAAVLPIRDLRRDPNEAYMRIHVMTANATAVQLKADSDIIVETSTRALLSAHYAGRPQETIMQANVLTLDLTASTQVTDVLPMRRADGRLIQDFPLEVTLNGATTFNVISEIVGPAL